MSAPPKPERRGPKARKPLHRPARPIARRTKPARVRRSKAGQAKAKADLAWAESVKRFRRCVALGREVSTSYGTHIGCGAGPLDAAHVMSRTFPATRFDASNGIPICRDVHRHFTDHPLAWENFCRQLIGDQEYQRLYALAHGNISR